MRSFAGSDFLEPQSLAQRAEGPTTSNEVRERYAFCSATWLRTESEALRRSQAQYDRFKRTIAFRPPDISDAKIALHGSFVVPGLSENSPFVRIGDLLILRSLALDPVEICRPVHELVIQPTDAGELGLPGHRIEAENQIRPAAALVQRLIELDPTPLGRGRIARNRVIGTCRHFAVLSCALLPGRY